MIEGKTMKITASELNKFVEREWKKTLSFLKNRYGLSEDDCKDVFQEAFIILYENIQKGKLVDLTSSLSTYFISICKNKALEFNRMNQKYVNEDNEMSMTLINNDIQSDKLDALLALDDDDELIVEQKEALVRGIVKELPSPCNEILWGFYRDNLSLKALAEMYNYSEGSAKVTKHRCSEKFRIRYNELCQQIYD